MGLKISVEFMHWNQLSARATVMDQDSSVCKFCQVAWRRMNAWFLFEVLFVCRTEFNWSVVFPQFVLVGFGQVNTSFVSVLQLFGTEFKRARSTCMRIFKFMEWFVFTVDKLLCVYSVLLLKLWGSRLVYPWTFWSAPPLVVHTTGVISDLEWEYFLITFYVVIFSTFSVDLQWSRG